MLRFASRDEDVATIYAGSISASTPVAVTFKVFDEAGREVASEAAQADAFPRPLLRRLPAGVRGRIFVLEARAAAPNAALTISDLRLNGQSAALRKYVTRALAFPTP